MAPASSKCTWTRGFRQGFRVLEGQRAARRTPSFTPVPVQAQAPQPQPHRYITAPVIHSYAAHEFMRKETSGQLPGHRFIPRQGLAFRKCIIREFRSQNSFLNQISVRLSAALLLVMLHQRAAWSDINRDPVFLLCTPCAHPPTGTLASSPAFSSRCLVQIDL